MHYRAFAACCLLTVLKATRPPVNGALQPEHGQISAADVSAKPTALRTTPQNALEEAKVSVGGWYEPAACYLMHAYI